MIESRERAKGASFVPIILGSDKTTVSVATGQNDYYPLYLSIGNVHNNVRRARRDAVSVISFLAIPKGMSPIILTSIADRSLTMVFTATRDEADSAEFRKFRRQLFHTSLSSVLRSLRPGMTTPQLVPCGDGYFRKVIFGLGPYIADYPEQALVACVVQGWCPM